MCLKSIFNYLDIREYTVKCKKESILVEILLDNKYCKLILDGYKIKFNYEKISYETYFSRYQIIKWFTNIGHKKN